MIDHLVAFCQNPAPGKCTKPRTGVETMDRLALPSPNRCLLASVVSTYGAKQLFSLLLLAKQYLSLPPTLHQCFHFFFKNSSGDNTFFGGSLFQVNDLVCHLNCFSVTTNFFINILDHDNLSYKLIH
ncbi:hypothetical protein CAEBREN_28784 [Caenorhabditis brenneri]|uniref:Uncharacterized protein n=1 Tax=Caenorhabditis brenneri TaxID=135651 RepID=G0M784_CAEBE|nr:hypothetical protein CAEBREN_28784 [Caenorhabditis brenneri]